GDHAVEVEVLDRVVLDVDGQALDRRVQGWAVRHRPAHQHAVDLEPQIIVHPAGTVTLDDEPAAPAIRSWRRRPGGLRRPGEVAPGLAPPQPAPLRPGLLPR